jgi:hypothetical protein
VVVGLTDVGRTTVVVLAINQASQVAVRQALIDEGRFPLREVTCPAATFRYELGNHDIG